MKRLICLFALTCAIGAAQTISGGGSSGGGSNTPTAPTIRAANLSVATVSGSTVTVSWPSGTVAGDTVYVFQGGFNSLVTTPPTGWTFVDTTFLSGASAQGAVIYRVLNSADITAGSITLNLSASGTESVQGAVTISGITPGIRSFIAARATGTSLALNTDGSPLTTDLVLLFAYARGAVTCSVSPGTALATSVNDSSAASGCLYKYTPAAVGGVSPTFSFNSSVTVYQIALVIKGIGAP